MNPIDAESSANGDAAIRDIAARWVVRRDRLLSPTETADLEAWLAADPRHAQAFQQSVASWQIIRELSAAVRHAPTVAPASASKMNWHALGGLAAAAVLVLVVAFDRESRRGPATDDASAAAVMPPAGSTIRHLADGSSARLKEGAEISEAFSVAERRIRLVRGEAFFTVEKDAARPFFVDVGNVTVRAVGTAFAIFFDPHIVEVLVTEGSVQVTPSSPTPVSAGIASEPVAPALVGAGHRAIVTRAPQPQAPAVVVSAVSPVEIARTLAWSEPMLDLAGTTLGELVTVFARRSGRRIEIADPVLASVRIGGRYPIDNVEGFIRGLEQIYEVKAERQIDGSIVLRKAR